MKTETLINLFKNRFRASDISAFEECKNEVDLIECLNKLFIKWEEELKVEYERQSSLGYSSYKLEEEIKKFAKECVTLITNYVQMSDVAPNLWMNLFKHRHYGYQFYELWGWYEKEESNDMKMSLAAVLKKPEYERTLYCAMADYFHHFYGNFYHNELAIRMICQYFPKKINFQDVEIEKIVSGLFPHITSAGTSEDSGFAFGGIGQIIKWIDNLSVKVVKELLKKYCFYHISNRAVYRHQISSIIKFSKLDEEEKKWYKFFYLDSVLILLKIEVIEYDKLVKSQNKYNVISHNLELCAAENLDFIRVNKNDNEETYMKWVNIKKGTIFERCLLRENQTIIRISLNDDKITISFKNCSMELPYDIEDWVLGYYESNGFNEKIENFLFKIKDDHRNNKEGKLLFSLVYLNDYRGIKNKQLMFDNTYFYNECTKSIGQMEDLKSGPVGFYGEKIYSMTCIAGKNGTGKTSIVNFLKDSFFKILYKIEEDEGLYTNNIVERNHNIELGLEVETDFLVVFKLGNDHFFLTNMSGVSTDMQEIKPYAGNERIRFAESSKMIYFSNKIDAGFTEDANTVTHISEDKFSEEQRSLDEFRIINYSVEASYYRNVKNEINMGYSNNNSVVSPSINQELCYQLAYLDWLRNENNNDLNEDWMKELKCHYKTPTGNIEEIDITEKLSEKYKYILQDYSAKIKSFSSGQYSKFDFLSKLFWCIKGYQKYAEKFHHALNQTVFSVQRCLQTGDTAVVFIDEGELYYHPEWQRTFISDILDMIHKYGEDDMLLQIIMTTNSPFILSDMLEEDVVYLSAAGQEGERKTFGQNIHTLLKDNFFMESTIGELSRRWIEKLIELLKPDENGNIRSWEDVEQRFSAFLQTSYVKPVRKVNVYEFLNGLITSIGLDFYREELLNMLNLCYEKDNKSYQLERLKQKKEELEKQIRNLEKEE